MEKEFIIPEGVAKARGFSHAVKVGNTIYVSGQIGGDEDGNIIGKGDMVAQTERAYENIRRTLEAAGASMTDIVMLNYYCLDLEAFKKTGEARKKYFGKYFPASTAVQVEKLMAPDALIEVEAIAIVG